MNDAKDKRIHLAVKASIGFSVALALALTLLFVGKFSGTEFTVFVVAFAVFAVVVGFAPEVQEFSVVGNVVKLREVKNEALKSIEILKNSQAELLRLLLRTKSFINRTHPQNPDQLAIDRDFWDIVAEAKRIGAVESIKSDLVACIDKMLVDLYSVAIGHDGPWREGFWIHKNIADVAADVLNPTMLSETSKARSEDESIYKGFAKSRVSEMKDLYALKDELSK